jgi:hypothetical protein
MTGRNATPTSLLEPESHRVSRPTGRRVKSTSNLNQNRAVARAFDLRRGAV